MCGVTENSDQMFFTLTTGLGHVTGCVRAGKSDADEGDSIWHLEKKMFLLIFQLWFERRGMHHTIRETIDEGKNSLSCVGISELKTSLQGMMSPQ